MNIPNPKPQSARTVQQLHDLRDRTALVTGGSRGLGLQMAHALGEAGARLMLSARKAGELAEAVAELRAGGIEAESFVADGSQEDQVLALADHAIERLGAVDILVNCAGTTWGAPAVDHPGSAWDKVMDVNARATFVLTRELGRRSMIPRHHGRIINIASVAALGGTNGSMDALAYCASKGAIVAMTRALACEWGPFGVTVNAILPGVFPSRMSKHLTTPERTAEMTRTVPLRRFGDDEALKGAVLLFASDAGKHITGQLLPVDGGVSAVVMD